MDDRSQGSHRTRPASSASSYNTRMTPSSTNSSALQLPRIPRTDSMRASGAGLLQERLREKKVETARKERRGSMDVSANLERGAYSSPAKIAKDNHRRPSSGGMNGRAMGVKQVEEQVTTLHKQNFDLKLELYHRRQRQEALEAQLEAAEKKLAEQEETQEINDQLLAELEKRGAALQKQDAALEEAVCMIVNLEDKIAKLIQDRGRVRCVEEHYAPSYSQGDQNDQDINEASSLPSSPPQLERSHRSVLRMPSFLSETTEGTEALRSLYLPHNSSYSDAPLPKLMEYGTQDGMNSPCISVLSESSFLSIYGDKNPPLDEPVLSPRRHRASSSIEKWVDERPRHTPGRPIHSARKNQFNSINDVLDSPLQRLEKLRNTLEKTNRGLHSSPANKSSVQEKRKSKEVRQLFTSKPRDYAQQHTLPPTPDTISTNTLRNHQNSNDTLADERHGNHLNTAPISAVPSPDPEKYSSEQITRPRSADETVTSRRDGHGWDTASQDTPTETGSADASITTFASQRYAKTGRIMTPNLFSFTESGWGKEVMYDHELSLPAHLHSASRYRDRRSSMVETPTSDETTVKHSSPSSSEDQRYGTSPIDTTVPPNLPDRRSSLIAATKIRKSSRSKAHEYQPTTHEFQPTTNESKLIATVPVQVPAKRSRMASLRIFGRSESIPVASTVSTVPVDGRAKSRAQSYVDRDEEDDDARATPPPIQRTRQVGPPTSYRPSSAGQGAIRRVSGVMGGETGGAAGGNGVRVMRGSVDVKETITTGDFNEGAGNEDGSTRGRKWFGIGGRSVSLRRT